MKTKAELSALALHWFRGLLQINTSNPPGNETKAVEFIASELAHFGIQGKELFLDEQRKNLVVELPGKEEGARCLLSSHTDVVTCEDEEQWSFPPFSAQEFEGVLWGRGALDMKYKVAFDMAALVFTKERNLKYGLKAAFVADEENGGAFGTEFLLREHRNLLDAEMVLNELGGFNVAFRGKSFYPVQFGEKGACHIRLHAGGEGTGHSGVPHEGNATIRLAQAISMLHDGFFGYVPSGLSHSFFQRLATLFSDSPIEVALLSLLSPTSAEAALEQFPSPLREQFRAMICNTICPTRVGGGFLLNVIPKACWVDLDCRLMPGESAEDFCHSLQLVGERLLPFPEDALRFEILDWEPGYEISLENHEAKRLCERANQWLHKERNGECVPYLLPASSDNTRYFHAGLSPIGFSPLLFTEGFPGFELSHSANERVPVEAFEKGFEFYLSVLEDLLSAD